MYVLADGSSACMRGSNDPCACMHGSSNDGVLSMHVRVLAKGELACVHAALEAEEAGAARLQASSSRRRREVQLAQGQTPSVVARVAREPGRSSAPKDRQGLWSNESLRGGVEKLFS